MKTGVRASFKLVFLTGILLVFLFSGCESDGRKSVGDIEVGYTIYGDGYPLIMIMGFSGTRDMWDPNVIAELSSRYKVIVFDNRGMGETTSGEKVFTIEQFADDTAGLIDALGISQANVLAWSMGNEIAFELVFRHPDKVNKMVMYAADCDFRMFPPTPETLAELTDTSGTPDEQAYRKLTLLFPEDWLINNLDYVEKVFSKVSETASPESIQRQSEAMNAWGGCTGRLGTLDKPVLLITGTEDILTPPQNSYYLVRHIPGARLVLYKDGGHGVMYQYPGRFSADVINFLQ